MSCHARLAEWAKAVEILAEDALAGQSEGEVDVYPRLRALEAEARALAAEMQAALGTDDARREAARAGAEAEVRLFGHVLS